MLLLEGIFIPSQPFLSYLLFVCHRFSIQSLVYAHPIHPSSSKLSGIVVYLMLIDGGCPNSLLLVNSIPSNSNHLFWNRDLESIEFLETYSH